MELESKSKYSTVFSSNPKDKFCPHTGPGAVGNSTPTIADAIHIITAIMSAFIHPILYNDLNANNQITPPIVAAKSPLPSRKCAIPKIIAPMMAVINALLIPSFSPNNLVTI
jgi:hypothetical protein